MRFPQVTEQQTSLVSEHEKAIKAIRIRIFAYGTLDKAREPCYYIPFTRKTRFTGYTSNLNALEDKFFD